MRKFFEQYWANVLMFIVWCPLYMLFLYWALTYTAQTNGGLTFQTISDVLFITFVPVLTVTAGHVIYVLLINKCESKGYIKHKTRNILKTFGDFLIFNALFLAWYATRGTYAVYMGYI